MLLNNVAYTYGITCSVSYLMQVHLSFEILIGVNYSESMCDFGTKLDCSLTREIFSDLHLERRRNLLVQRIYCAEDENKRPSKADLALWYINLIVAIKNKVTLPIRSYSNVWTDSRNYVSMSHKICYEAINKYKFWTKDYLALMMKTNVSVTASSLHFCVIYPKKYHTIRVKVVLCYSVRIINQH